MGLRGAVLYIRMFAIVLSTRIVLREAFTVAVGMAWFFIFGAMLPYVDFDIDRTNDRTVFDQ